MRRRWTLERLAAEVGRDPRALGKSLLRKNRPQLATTADLAKALGFPDPEFVARVLFRRLEDGDEMLIESRIRDLLYRRRIWKYGSVPLSDRVGVALRSLRAKDKAEYKRVLAAVACVELGLERAPEHTAFPPALAALTQALKTHDIDLEYDASEEENFGREAAIEAHAAWRWLCQARGILEDGDGALEIWHTLRVPVEYQRTQVLVQEGSAGPHVGSLVSREVDFSPYPWREDHPLRKASSEELSRPGYGVVGYVDILDATKAAFREARQRICEQESRAAAATPIREPSNQSTLDLKHERETTMSIYRRKSGKKKQ